MRKFIPVLLAAVLAPAPSMAQEDSTRPPPRTVRRIPDRITYEEIQTLPDARDGYELVRAPRHAVLESRRLSAADATTKYGVDQNGVILVRVITSAPR